MPEIGKVNGLPVVWADSIVGGPFQRPWTEEEKAFFRLNGFEAAPPIVIRQMKMSQCGTCKYQTIRDEQE